MGNLRQGTFVHENSDEEIQIGSTPEHTVVFADLSEEERQWLLSLRNSDRSKGQEMDQLSQRQQEMLALLREASLLEPQPKPITKLRIRIEGLDRVGLNLVDLLVKEGVKQLDVRDSRRVDADVEHLFPAEAKGLRRADSLREMLSANPRLRLGRITYPDVVISCNSHVWDHAQAGMLLGYDINHVPIVSGDRAIDVGPFMCPGVTACAVCVDMHVRDTDPTWPNKHLALEGADPIPPSSHMTAVAAGLALTMIESAALRIPLNPEKGERWQARKQRLERSPAGPLTMTLAGASHSLRVTQRGVETSTWLPHPDCSCIDIASALHGAAS